MTQILSLENITACLDRYLKDTEVFKRTDQRLKTVRKQLDDVVLSTQADLDHYDKLCVEYADLQVTYRDRLAACEAAKVALSKTLPYANMAVVVPLGDAQYWVHANDRGELSHTLITNHTKRQVMIDYHQGE